MILLSILPIAVALGVDAMSLAISIGLAGIRRRQFFLVTAIVTVFHILMPLFGVSLGRYLGRHTGPLAGVIGALVLIAIGLSSIWSSIRELQGAQQEDKARDKWLLTLTSPVSLILIAVSVSLDALTVGFGLGTLKADLVLTVITIGLVAGIMTAAGLFFGRRLNHKFGEKAEIVAGLILVAVGIKFLI